MNKKTIAKVVLALCASTVLLLQSTIISNKIFVPIMYKHNYFLLGAAVADQYLSTDVEYANIVKANYQAVTPENEGKYYFVSEYGWSPMDRIVLFAEENNLQIYYHCLAWSYGEQPEDYLEWITQAVGRYGNLIKNWDVINEGYAPDGTPTLDNIELILQSVKVINPEIVRWYNGILTTKAEQHSVIVLIEQELVQAVGIQMHLSLESDLSVYIPILEYIINKNIPWRISEFEVYIPDTSEEMLKAQANKYSEAVQLLLKYKGESFNTWGFTDGVSWQPQNFPLPFTTEYVPKPAWFALTLFRQ